MLVDEAVLRVDALSVEENARARTSINPAVVGRLHHRVGRRQIGKYPLAGTHTVHRSAPARPLVAAVRGEYQRQTTTGVGRTGLKDEGGVAVEVRMCTQQDAGSNRRTVVHGQHVALPNVYIRKGELYVGSCNPHTIGTNRRGNILVGTVVGVESATVSENT